MKKIFPILGLAILLCAALITLAITGEPARDPVCGMEVSTANATFTLDSPHGTIYFCSQACMGKFLADPAAYTPKMEPGAAPQPAAQEKRSGCEGCPAHAAKAASQAAAQTSPSTHGCDSNCGNTKVKEINDFHKAMSSLEAGEGQANVALLKTAAADLVAKKDAVMTAKCPEGICSEGFTATRADFGKKVDALHAAVQSGDDSAIAAAFKEMHAAYEALDVMAR